jgi:hypothetical protein
MKRWTIYCHIHIESGRRYIGMTSYTMMHRWNQHCSQAKNLKNERRSHFAHAIRFYGKDAFSHEILAQAWDLEGANETEEALILQEDTRNPLKGFNLAKGGGSKPNLIKKPMDRPEFRAKALANLAKANAITFAERSARSKKNWSDPNYRERSVFANIISHSTLEVRQKMSISQRMVKSLPDVKKRHSMASERLWKSKSYRMKMLKFTVYGGALNRAKTNCPSGHEYSTENTYVNRKGSRVCRVCARAYQYSKRIHG